MKKRILGTIAGVALASAGLHAQVGVGVGGGVGGGIGVGRSGGGAAGAMIEQFQQAGTFAPVATGRGISMVNTTQTVAGRPVSGIEVQKSTQTLGDGTEISTSESVIFFRDSAGRTRKEMPEGRTIIVDPVAKMTVTLIANSKTARKMPMLGEPPKLGVVLSDTVRPRIATSGSSAATYTFSVVDGPSTTTVTTGGPIAARDVERRTTIPDNMKREDLGVESLSGVLATHTRNTLTIPQGQIGNNRDIHVVNERWYSDDLQMLVKTVNSDPRFGENTYELTNISRDEPNPSLFQIPPDYAVLEPNIGRDFNAMPPPVVK